MSTVLEVNNIEVVYQHTVQVLRGLSLSVPEGSIVAMLGANGAGKTTTLKAVSGLLPLENGEVASGNITFFGDDIKRIAPHDLVRRGLFHVMEGRRVFEDLSVEANLIAATYAAGSRKRTNAFDEVYAYFPRLAERRRQQAGYLSGGEQQMLAIGRALMTNPRLLILDEATEGLAPVVRQEIWAAIARLKAETGMAIIVVDKSLKELGTVADTAVILEKGRSVWTGDFGDLTPELTDRYLGV